MALALDSQNGWLNCNQVFFFNGPRPSAGMVKRLMGCLWCPVPGNLKWISDLIQHAPKILDQIGIWGIWRPGQHLKLFHVPLAVHCPAGGAQCHWEILLSRRGVLGPQWYLDEWGVWLLWVWWSLRGNVRPFLKRDVVFSTSSFKF